MKEERGNKFNQIDEKNHGYGKKNPGHGQKK